MGNNTFQNRSYERHSEHFVDYASGGSKESHAQTWLQTDTVDAWRHQRMHRLLDPILAKEPEASWLTVGDGRFGKDAKYILDKGSQALASDISDVLLKEAKDNGYLPDYRKENAESLSFEDSSFDYVYCKESYHHFPRPMLALYEMLRVSTKGVVLTEPDDAYITKGISEIVFRRLKNLLKLCLGKSIARHHFEESGNYEYSLSRRELEKVALGLNYKTLAFQGINDAYLAGVEYEKLNDKGTLQKKVRALINIKNILCRLGLMKYQLLTAIIFKQSPSKTLLRALSNQGYQIIHLPDNPYLPI